MIVGCKTRQWYSKNLESDMSEVAPVYVCKRCGGLCVIPYYVVLNRRDKFEVLIENANRKAVCCYCNAKKSSKNFVVACKFCTVRMIKEETRRLL